MKESLITQREIDFFEKNGYLVIENLIDTETIEDYKKTIIIN
jgi:ectoine hydroxylase-related dioxygenase (phytanoyl-CoA dioxygenase family)